MIATRPYPVRRIPLLLVAVLSLAGCAPVVERSGVGGASSVSSPAIEARWAVIDGEPAIDELTVRGTVVVQAAEQLVAPSLGRIVDLPLGQGEPVAVGDVIAVVQPTTPEIEAFDVAARRLEEATVAASGPAAGRPSPADIEALVAARDQAAAAVLAAGPAADLTPIEVVAGSAGVVVNVVVPLGTLVDTDDLIATVGPVSSVEVHVRVDDAVLELFAAAAGEAVLVEREVGAEPQVVALAPEAQRVVTREESVTVLRMVFVDSPRVTEGQRVDVEVAIEPAPDARSVPLDAVRVFDGATFVLVEDDAADGGVRRVEVDVARLGTERAEITGPVDEGDRVLLR